MKINKTKRIGQIVIIVEGAVTEFLYIEQMFHNYLDYEVVSNSRKDNEIRVLKGHDKYSKVFIINAPTNDIVSINDDEKIEQYIYDKLSLLPIINNFNYQTYIVFDRDPKNNSYKIVKNLLSKYNSSLTNDESLNGLLCLSYPALESFLISLYEKDSYELKMKFGKDLKEYIREKCYTIDDLNANKIMMAYENLLSFLSKNKFINEEQEITNVEQYGLQIFEAQQELYKIENKFNCISQLLEILIDLQIIEV